MNLKEVFERIGCGERDELARRITNTSRAPAAITAEEIEAGVTLERLDRIDVPVFRYQTQITIHGELPDFNPEARPAGYKAVFRNANGTLGVRYVALDGEKKRVMVECSKLGKAEQIFSASLNSQGLTVSKFFMEKEPCLAAFAKLKELSGLFYGSLWAGACPLGGYMAGADIGAIPAANLWPLCAALFGVKSAQEAADLKAARELLWQEQRAKCAAEQAANQAVRQQAKEIGLAKARAALTQSGNCPLSTVPLPGDFIAVLDGWTEVKVLRYSVRKGSFGRWLYRTSVHPGQIDDSKKKQAG